MNEEFDDDGLGPFRGLISGAVPLAVFWICVALVACSLAGCGGGGDGPADELQAIESTANAQGGSDAIPAAVVAARLMGPEIEVHAPTRFVIELRTTWVQRVATDTNLRIAVNAGGASEAPTYVDAGAAFAPERTVSALTRWHVDAQPGTTALVATARLQSTDAGGIPVAALGRFTLSAEWSVKVAP